MMIESLKKLDEQVSLWPGISSRLYHSTGRQFRLGSVEIGRVFQNGQDGVVDIAFTRAFRNVLLAEGHAEEHPSKIESSRVIFRLNGDSEVEHALWLLRLSYLRYALKAVPDPAKRFQEESERLRLTPRVRCALWRFVPVQKKELVA